MIINHLAFLTALEVTIFLCSIFMNITRRNSQLVFTYFIQSTCVVLVLLISYSNNPSIELLTSAALTLLVKVIAAPIFFYKLISREQMRMSISTYLSTPLTLAVLLALTILAKSDIFTPFLQLLPNSQNLLIYSLATILMSMFVIVNRKGTLSQIVGILSLDNAIVSFSSFVGAEQTAGLEVGIIFDILLWIVVASIFISMMYSRFKVLDVTQLNRLRD